MITMQDNFAVGINYWPARKAMYWWKAFDAAEVDRDLAILRSYGIQQVRIFSPGRIFSPDLIASMYLAWTIY